MKKKLKVAYVCIEDSDDLTKWSGLLYYVKKAISQQDIEIVVIDKLNIKKSLITFARKIVGKITGKSYHTLRSKLILKPIALEIQKRLPNDVDFILATSSLPITYLETKVPIFFYVDATFHSMLDFYFPIKQLSSKTLIEGEEQEQLAISKATGLFYASKWAANDAITHYKAAMNKVKVLPFGANINFPISERFLTENLVSKLTENSINLLFVGVDWERKGGSIVYDTAKNLIKLGYKVHLDIVGLSKFPFNEIPEFCTNHGFISKNEEEGKNKLNQLYLKADFLFVPSKQECLGIVFAEASSLGLPSISTNVGGIPDVIEDGVTGFALDINATPKMYEERISNLVKNKKLYDEMALNAYHKALRESNWETVGKEIINHMKSLT